MDIADLPCYLYFKLSYPSGVFVLFIDWETFKVIFKKLSLYHSCFNAFSDVMLNLNINDMETICKAVTPVNLSSDHRSISSHYIPIAPKRHC